MFFQHPFDPWDKCILLIPYKNQSWMNGGSVNIPFVPWKHWLVATQTFFMFKPGSLGFQDPIWPSYFFKWVVETTNWITYGAQTKVPCPTTGNLEDGLPGLGSVVRITPIYKPWHILGDRLIPWTPLRVDRGILPVGPTKSWTNLAGFSLRVAKLAIFKAMPSSRKKQFNK